jgi:sortase (surface protein transpeptidase)
MSLNDQQRKFYENTLTVTKQETADLDRQIEEELAKVKEKLAQLQNAKKAARQMYDAACLRLGIPNDLEAEEEGSAEI